MSSSVSSSISTSGHIYIFSSATNHVSMIWWRKPSRKENSATNADQYLRKVRRCQRNGQHNDQKINDKRTNNGLQNIHRKLKIEERKPHYKVGWSQVVWVMVWNMQKRWVGN